MPPVRRRLDDRVEGDGTGNQQGRDDCRNPQAQDAVTSDQFAQQRRNGRRVRTRRRRAGRGNEPTVRVVHKNHALLAATGRIRSPQKLGVPAPAVERRIEPESERLRPAAPPPPPQPPQPPVLLPCLEAAAAATSAAAAAAAVSATAAAVRPSATTTTTAAVPVDHVITRTQDMGGRGATGTSY